MSVSFSPPAASAPAGRLSADLRRVIEAFGHREVTLGEIIELMQQRAYLFLLLLIALPFSTPVPLPGLSTPFGMIIAFIGVRIACGLSPWLPDRMLRVRLPAKWLPKIFRAAERLVIWLEKFLKPRLSFVVQAPALRRLHGVIIAICGILLLLPLPIPMTNLFPALSVVLLACALLENDGYFSVAGGVVFLMAGGYFTLLGFGGTTALTATWDWVRARFD